MVLKIASDEYPHLKIIATGSSTLEATSKFRDSLAGRKHSLILPPVLWSECVSFDIFDLDRRLLNGGFPEMLLATAPEPLFFEEWIDSFYARDIMELFGVRNRVAFLSLLKLLFLRNGGLLNITDLSKEAGISRPTVMAYIEALRISHVISRIPPFHGGSHREIIRQPKTYAFDTGMISHVRGWHRIRETDRGHLWENLVLDELRASFPETALHYWRDKNRREIDFVIVRTSSRIDTVEAKINPNAFNSSNLKAFRDRYPEGNDYLVCPYVKDPYQIRAGERPITVCGIEQYSKRNNRKI